MCRGAVLEGGGEYIPQSAYGGQRATLESQLSPSPLHEFGGLNSGRQACQVSTFACWTVSAVEDLLTKNHFSLYFVSHLLENSLCFMLSLILA